MKTVLAILMFFISATGVGRADDLPVAINVSQTFDGRVQSAEVVVVGKLAYLPGHDPVNVVDSKTRRQGEITVSKVIKGGARSGEKIALVFWWSDLPTVKLIPAYQEGDEGVWFLHLNDKNKNYHADMPTDFIPVKPGDAPGADLVKTLMEIQAGLSAPEQNLNSKNARQRAAALFAIATRIDARYVNMILRAGGQVFEDAAKKKIIKVMDKELRSRKEILQKMFNDAEPRVTLYAAAFLASDFMAQETVPKLIELLASPEADIRMLAADALHQLTGRTFLTDETELGQLWEKGAPEQRQKTIVQWNEWLPENKDKHFVQWLVESLIESREPFWARGRAVDLLRHITGKKYEYNAFAPTKRERRIQLEPWESWWVACGNDFIKTNFPNWTAHPTPTPTPDSPRPPHRTPTPEDDDDEPLPSDGPQ